MAFGIKENEQYDMIWNITQKESTHKNILGVTIDNTL